MHHPDAMFTDPGYARENLEKLAAEFDRWQRGRAKPIKPVSRRKYQYSLEQLWRFMRREGIPLELRHLHPHAVNGWVADCRDKGQSEEGIASTLTAIKVFSNSFVTKQLELCLADPLRKVPRITPPERDVDILEDSELEALLGAYGDVAFEDVRNKAFLAVLMSTGGRLREVRELQLSQWDQASSEITFHGKGDKIRYARLGDRPGKLLRAYLKLRPRHTSSALWLARDGTPVGESCWTSVIRRLKKSSGVERVHAHLFRHTFGSTAIAKGYERAAVQDMLGHETDLMTRRYTREARRRTASAMMPGASPI